MNAMVTFGLTAVLALPAVSCAQDHKPAQDRPAQRRSTAGQELHRAQERQPAPGAEQHKTAPDDKTPRRLDSVTWDSVHHQLTWVISRGARDTGGDFKSTGSENYEINMDKATMTFSGETRRFSKEEAANVHVLMDVISKYAVDSTVWWDEGQGEPVNGPSKKEEKKPSKDAAVLHVSLRTPDGISADDVQARIDQLRARIEQLEQLKLAIRATSPAPLRTN